MTDRINDANLYKINQTAKHIESLCADALTNNFTAVALAELLTEGKSKQEILVLCQFINVLSAAVKMYIV